MSSLRTMGQWCVVAAATVMSTIALDATAAVAGTLLAASQLLDGASRVQLAFALVSTYALWAAGLRANLVANWHMLEQTGLSTNLLSKTMFEVARRRWVGRRPSRVASALGYIGTEVAKEFTYIASAVGAAVVSDAVESTDALVFLAGTNIGAATYEFGLARMSRVVVERRRRRAGSAVIRSRRTSGSTARTSQARARRSARNRLAE